MANKTNIWNIFSQDNIQNYTKLLSNINIEESDIDRIHEMYCSLIEQEEFIDRFCKKEDIQALQIDYEDLAANIKHYANIVAEYIGLPNINSLDFSTVKVQKLASPLSDKTCRLYRKNTIV